MSTQSEKVEREYDITTTAQVERVYRVTAGSQDQAHQRLRSHLKDADALRMGIVIEQRDRQIDATPQKVKGVKAIPVKASSGTATNAETTVKLGDATA